MFVVPYIVEHLEPLEPQFEVLHSLANHLAAGRCGLVSRSISQRTHSRVLTNKVALDTCSSLAHSVLISCKRMDSKYLGIIC